MHALHVIQPVSDRIYTFFFALNVHAVAKLTIVLLIAVAEGCISHCQSNSHHNLLFTLIMLPLGIMAAYITFVGALNVWRRFPFCGRHRHPTIRYDIIQVDHYYYIDILY